MGDELTEQSEREALAQRDELGKKAERSKKSLRDRRQRRTSVRHDAEVAAKQEQQHASARPPADQARLGLHRVLS